MCETSETTDSEKLRASLEAGPGYPAMENSLRPAGADFGAPCNNPSLLNLSHLVANMATIWGAANPVF